MENNFQDREIVCCQCQQNFVWSASDQEFYAKQGFVPPKRCPPCRRARNEQKKNRQGKR